MGIHIETGKMICKSCGFCGTEDEFDVSHGIINDFICPKCSSPNIDTSEINRLWFEKGYRYEYGNDNTLQEMR
jgi:Zn finger protein HypA/HybF involved in hydrogenase expression